MILPETLSNPILKSLAAVLGASLWVETPEALIFGRHVTAALLVHWPDVGRWWELVDEHLEYPEAVQCETCGKFTYRGRASARIIAPGVGPVLVDVYVLGHDHAGIGDGDVPRWIYFVESIKLATQGIDEQILAESSIRFSSPLAPSSVRDTEPSEANQDNELDAYLNSLGHKLRTPLNNILGYSEMLREEGLEADAFANHSLQRIEQSGRMVLDVVDELELHLAREHSKRKLASILQKVSMVMTSSLDLKEVVVRIHECIAQIVHFDGSYLLWVRDGCLEGSEVSEGVQLRLDPDRYPFRRVFENLPAIQYIGELDYDRLSNDVKFDRDYRSWLCLPLMGTDGPLALITLVSKRVDDYGDLDLDLLTAFSHHASLALSNARQYNETRKLAEIDPLTEALSRRHFFELAQQKFDAAEHANTNLSLMIFDIDHFKQVNDTHGHSAGDQALKQVVNQCQLALRPLDLVGRYGGEEFVVLLPNVDLQVALMIADRVRRRISLTEVKTDNASFHITISAGVATCHLEQDTDIEVLLKRADAALYRAKEGGRDRVMAEEFNDEPITVQLPESSESL